MQMITSTILLFAMRRWKIISFISAESRGSLDNYSSPSAFVSIPTLLHTLPVSFAFLLYMVNLSFIYLKRAIVIFNQYFFIYTFLMSTVGFHGVCSWSECSHVYNPSTHNCCIYNGRWILSVSTKILSSDFWQVNIYCSFFWRWLTSVSFIYTTKNVDQLLTF